MKKAAVVITLAMVFALTSTFAFGWCPLSNNSGTADEVCFRAALPDLTPAQYDRIESLKNSCSNEIVPLREELVLRGQELRTLWSDPMAEPGLIKTKQNEMFDLRSRFEEKVIHHNFQIERVLTAEQLAQLQASGNVLIETIDSCPW